MRLVEVFRRGLLRIIYGRRATPELFIEDLRGRGVSIGEGTVFFDPINTIIDTQNPKLLTIGSKVRVTSGCIILTHDYSWSVVASLYGECMGAVGPVTIGNNVFIGVNTVIMKDTVIGNNVIIGAGSIVKGNVESNSVYAGNPAKKIMTIDEFYERRKLRVEEEICSIIRKIDSNDANEFWKYMREYSCYFSDASEKSRQQIMVDGGNYDLSVAFYKDKARKTSAEFILQAEE